MQSIRRAVFLLCLIFAGWVPQGGVSAGAFARSEVERGRWGLLTVVRAGWLLALRPAGG